MAQKKVRLAILFADVSGSTQLFEKYGDVVARNKIADVLKLLTNTTKQNTGIVVKTIGDEVMCIFPKAEQGVTAACNMQEILKNMNTENNDGIVLNIRVGIHFGPALMENKDVFGDAVNIAARMATQAKGEQIITTGTTIQHLSPELKEKTRFVDKAPIKGKQQEIEIYEIIWQEEDVTHMATVKPIQNTPQIMKLKYKEREVKINTDSAIVVLGRGQTCDLAVNEQMASRQHARVELRRNKFFIIDQSTNGTYILLNNITNSFLRREEMEISGEGQISLGRSFEENPTEVVRFSQN